MYKNSSIENGWTDLAQIFFAWLMPFIRRLNLEWHTCRAIISHNIHDNLTQEERDEVN
jgi:hypothetical protein